MNRKDAKSAKKEEDMIGYFIALRGVGTLSILQGIRIFRHNFGYVETLQCNVSTGSKCQSICLIPCSIGGAIVFPLLPTPYTQNPFFTLLQRWWDFELIFLVLLLLVRLHGVRRKSLWVLLGRTSTRTSQ
jgi:hypothetical protein